MKKYITGRNHQLAGPNPSGSRSGRAVRLPSRDEPNRKALIVDVKGRTAGLVVDEVTEVAKLDTIANDNPNRGATWLPHLMSEVSVAETEIC